MDIENINLQNEMEFASVQIDILKHVKRELDPVLPKGYEITSFISEGSIGSVYTTYNKSTNQFLATKIVKTVTNKHLSHKIKQEYLIQKPLQHCNIAEVYGIKSTFSYIIIFMELFTGGDLFDLIPVGRGINIQKGFEIYQQLLDAVEYLHSCSIVHMDIKPENIMISGSGKPKLIDFGVAVNHRNTPFIMGHLGTFAYSAPETLLFRGYQGYKADLFSLNVTFLTAVTGERCWNRACSSDFHYFDWVNKQWTLKMSQRLPPDLLSFMIGALAHKPNERLSIEQIKSHIWFRKGLQKKIESIRPPSEVPGSDYFPQSQPPIMKDILNTSFVELDMDIETPLSQPVDLTELLMPECKNRNQMVSIVKRITRFFSAKNFSETFSALTSIIDQHQQCSIIQKSSNHLMVSSSHSSEIQVLFRIFVYKFDNSILVDFRRYRGDGLLFRNLFSDIINSAKQFGLVDEKHPYLNKVKPKYQ